MLTYIEFVTYNNEKISLPVGSFGYKQDKNKVLIFLLNSDTDNWIVNENYENFNTRVLELL
jgi:hypothetical protein